MNLARHDIATLINVFVANAERAAHLLAQRYGLPIRCEHVETALADTFSLDESIDLLDLGLTTEAMLASLQEYKFDKLFPTVPREVVFEESIIPTSVPWLLQEQRVRHHGQV